MAGGLGSLAGALGLESAQETLEGVAEDKFQRALVEMGLIVGGEAAVRTAGKALSRQKRLEAAELMEVSVTDNTLLADGMGVLVRDPKDLTPATRQAAEDAFGDTQAVFSPVKESKGLGDWLRWQYIKWVDIDKPFEWASVRGMRPSEDPNVLARNRRGSGAAAARIWEDGLVKPGTTEAPRTMAPDRIIKDLAGGDVEALGWSMIAKREEELLRRGHDARLTPEQLASGKQLFDDNPGIRNAHQAFIEYGREWLRLLEEEGIIKAGAAGRIMSAGNYWYVPLKRLETGKTKLPRSLEFGDPLQNLSKGGEGAVYQNPAAAWVDLTFALTDMVHRRRVISAIAAIGDEGLNPAVVGRVAKRPKGESLADVETGLSALGDDVASTIADGVDIIKGRGGKNFFRLFDNYYQVDDFLFEAMRHVDHAEIPAAARILTAPGKLLRTGVTITPGFAGANMFRDSIMRTMTVDDLPIYQSMYGAVGAGVDLTKEVLHRMGMPVKESRIVDAFELSGGAMSTLADMDANRFVSVLDDMRKATPGYTSNLSRMRRQLRETLHTARMLGSVSENSNRVDTFELVRQRMLAEGADEIDANLMAAFQAAESTVDFRRRGRLFEENPLVKGIDQGTAFWRAAIQGVDRVNRLFVDVERTGVKANKSRIAKVAATAATTLTVPALANYAANRQNPEYFDIPKNVRGRYILFDLGAEGVEELAQYVGAADDYELPLFRQGASTWLKVPVPHELGWLFATIPVRMLEEVDPKNPQRDITVPNMAGAADPLVETFRQIGIPIPTGIGVAEQLASNKDRFRGTPIEPQFSEDRPAPLRARGTESPGAVALSTGLETLGLPGVPVPSPPQIEFGIRGVLGGAGTAALLDVPGLLVPNESSTTLTEKGPL
ncbi:MAG: LPD38 domain-containing protein, partial [Planctomycetota bacterium]